MTIDGKAAQWVVVEEAPIEPAEHTGGRMLGQQAVDGVPGARLQDLGAGGAGRGAADEHRHRRQLRPTGAAAGGYQEDLHRRVELLEVDIAFLRNQLEGDDKT